MKNKVSQIMLPVGVLLLLGGTGGIALSNTPATTQKPTINYLRAPEWNTTKETWINTDGKAKHLYGQNGAAINRVTILTFWTHGCINCRRTIPFWNDWAKRFATREGKTSDVAIVSVHTPETRSERSTASVRRFVKEKGILFPVVTDNSSMLWDAYNVQAWPTTILIDKQGRIRGHWEGELDFESSGEFKKVEKTIEALRREK